MGKLIDTDLIPWETGAAMMPDGSNVEFTYVEKAAIDEMPAAVKPALNWFNAIDTAPEAYEDVILETEKDGYVVAYHNGSNWYVTYCDEFPYCEVGSHYAVRWMEVPDNGAD